MVYSKPLGRMVRSQFGQSVGLGDFCDCIYCPWLGQLCTCSHGDGEGKQDKKPKMHSIPIKGSGRAGPGLSLPSSGPLLSPPKVGSASRRIQNRWQGSLTPPFCYLGWLTNAASYSKPKIQSWGSSRTRCQHSQTYLKCKKPSQVQPGFAAFSISVWIWGEILGFEPWIVCLTSPLSAG